MCGEDLVNFIAGKWNHFALMLHWAAPLPTLCTGCNVTSLTAASYLSNRRETSVSTSRLTLGKWTSKNVTVLVQRSSADTLISKCNSWAKFWYLFANISQFYWRTVSVSVQHIPALWRRSNNGWSFSNLNWLQRWLQPALLCASFSTSPTHSLPPSLPHHHSWLHCSSPNELLTPSSPEP